MQTTAHHFSAAFRPFLTTVYDRRFGAEAAFRRKIRPFFAA
jgi:hypothetical protein